MNDSDLPSIELLESAHAFPCAYVFKVIGRAEGDFAGLVVQAVRDELGLVADPPHSLRHTEHRRHVAVTLEPILYSGQQVLEVYRRLRKVPGLVYLL